MRSLRGVGSFSFLLRRNSWLFRNLLGLVIILLFWNTRLNALLRSRLCWGIVTHEHAATCSGGDGVHFIDLAPADLQLAHFVLDASPIHFLRPHEFLKPFHNFWLLFRCLRDLLCFLLLLLFLTLFQLFDFLLTHRQSLLIDGDSDGGLIVRLVFLIVLLLF